MSSAPIAIRDLSLMSGLFAVHAPALISSSQAPASAALLEYSRLSRTLLRQWWHCLESPRSSEKTASLAAIAEEVLVSEITSRVVAGVFAVCDARTGRRASSPFARAALLDLMQAKHWVLSRLVQGPQPLGAFLELNTLRRKTERWCDCLLGALPDSHAAAQFAVDPDRLREFAQRSSVASSHAGQYLTIVSLRLAMPTSAVEDPERCETYRALLRTLISFWPQAAYDSSGLLRGPLWQRLRGLTDLAVPADADAPARLPELEVINRRLRSPATLSDGNDAPRRRW